MNGAFLNEKSENDESRATKDAASRELFTDNPRANYNSGELTKRTALQAANFE
jgi:hypothetical protein